MTDPEIVDLSSKKNTFPFGSDMARNRVPFLAALTIDSSEIVPLPGELMFQPELTVSERGGRKGD